MDKKQLFQKVLESVSKDMENQIPAYIPVGDKQIAFSNYFNELNDLLDYNGAYSNEAPSDSMTDFKTRHSRSTFFAAKALNSIYMTNKYNENIDNFFNNPNNNSLFEGYTAEQKRFLNKEFKDYVELTLAVDTKSDKATQYVESLKKDFTDESYVNGLSYIYNYNLFLEDLEKNSYFMDYNHYREKFNENFPDEISSLIFEGISDSNDDLAKEDNWDSKKNVHEYVIPNQYNTSRKVDPKDFVEKYKNNKESLGLEERQWAGDIFFDMCQGDNLFCENIMVDGHPMFTEEQLSTQRPIDLYTEVVARALLGEKVTEKTKDGEEVLWSLKLDQPQHEMDEPTMAEPEQKKGVFAMIMEFFENLLASIGVISKKQEMEKEQPGITEITEEDINAFRKKISLDELSGKHNAQKIENLSKNTNFEKVSEHSINGKSNNAGKSL